MKSIRSAKPVLLAGLAAILATTAVAQEAGVWFRGTDGQAVRSAQERSPRLEFPAATNLLLGGTALSAPAPFSGPAGPFRLQASDGQIRVCDDAACTTPGAWGATAAPRSGQFVQASRPGPRSPGETVRVAVDGAGLKATFEASARLGAPTFGAFATRTVSPGELAESDLSTFRGWVETDLAVTGGSVRVCPPQGSCGAWSTRETIREGDQIQLRGEAGAFGTTRTVTVSAGGAEGAFSILTREKDTTPAAFAFVTGPTGVNPGATLVSNSVTLTGFDDAPVSIVGGEYALNGGAFTASAGTARANDAVQVRLTGGGFGETRTATLTVGGQSASWSATVRAKDEMPDAFTLGSDSNAEPNVAILSATATLANFDSARILISGHDATYAVNGGTFTSQPGEVRAGDRVQVRMTSGAFGVERQASLTVGDRVAVFVIRTRVRDETPDEISFPERTGQTPGAEVLSDVRRLTSHDGVAMSVSGTGTAFRICSDAACSNTLAGWFSSATVAPGQYIQIRQTAPVAGQTQTATIRYGTLSTTWSVSSSNNGITGAYATAQLPGSTRKLAFVYIPSGTRISSNSEYKAYCESKGFDQNQNAHGHADYRSASMHNTVAFYAGTYCSYLGNGNTQAKSLSNFVNYGLPLNTELRVLDRGCGDYNNGRAGNFETGLNTTDGLRVTSGTSFTYLGSAFGNGWSSDFGMTPKGPTYPNNGVIVCQTKS